jgi:hypothetical protein
LLTRQTVQNIAIQLSHRRYFLYESAAFVFNADVLPSWRSPCPGALKFRERILLRKLIRNSSGKSEWVSLSLDATKILRLVLKRVMYFPYRFHLRLSNVQLKKDPSPDICADA